MISIPSLTQTQLALLRTAKKYPGMTVRLCYETPITDLRKPPFKNPPFIQKLVDFGLIEVEFKQVLNGPSLFQKDSWHEYCADLELPSIRAWELWREAFIATLHESTHVLVPGENFEDFTNVWIQEISFHATQPQ
ncbi:hypothetical protein [Acaryochloris sp. CCMEE 5410]|uniref:hypothetical protein n=1 Tax=Acaryochloris sp. CCMEE 5410 TaxID=310037 RepID=UPI00024848D4|nr:hypothetical protein [Acaryochloris sp. CCMEE 5410]KAI9129835.1 hypothetical protein ON05_032445 [Acaryochloris sp. CCMEE 5410]